MDKSVNKIPKADSASIKSQVNLETISELKVGQIAAESNSILDFVSITNSLVAAFLFAAFFFFHKKIIIFVKNHFGEITFFSRTCHFKHQQSTEGLAVCVTGDKHLHAKTLLGDVDPPATYGLYTINKKGGPSRIEFNAKIKGKEFKKIARYVKNCIVPFRAKIYELDVDQKWQDSISAEYIINNHIVPSIKKGSPQLFLIRGKVGCGKSTLVIDIASKITISNMADTSISNTAAIVINIRTLLFKKFRFDDTFNSTIIQPNFTRDILDCIKEEVVRLLWETKIPNINADMEYKSAINACYDNKVSPLIILDEMDFLYTDFSKRIVSNQGGQDQTCIKMYKELFSDVCSLHLNVPTPTTNSFSNTIFLIVARSSTKVLMEEVLNRKISDGICHIKIDEADYHAINKIISRQLKVLSKISEGLSNRNLTTIIEQLDRNQINYSKNVAVSVHGVRHLMNAISKIKEIDPGDYELLKLVLCKPGLLRLYQYIDGNSDYSQAEEGISNIYLVNRDAPKKCNEDDSRGHHNGFDQWLLKDHLQTYWLKYFICAYITKMSVKQENSETCLRPQPFVDVVNVFHSKGSNEKTQYEEPLVKLALLHASKVDHGRLIKFGHSDGFGNTVMPSNRLLEMRKSNLFWDFGYLMVIVEDKWLEFPSALYIQLKRVDDKNVYDFITKFHMSEEAEKVAFIKHKAAQSLTFFYVLKEALVFEKIRYKSVFKRLQENGVDTDITAAFEKHLNTSIEEFTRRYVSEPAALDILKFVDDFKSKKQTLTKSIKNGFSNYHRRPSFKSVDAMMTVYFSQGTEQAPKN